MHETYASKAGGFRKIDDTFDSNMSLASFAKKFNVDHALSLIALLAVGTALQCFFAGKGNEYTHYNN